MGHKALIKTFMTLYATHKSKGGAARQFKNTKLTVYLSAP